MVTEASENDGIRNAGPAGRHITIPKHNLSPQPGSLVIFQDSKAPYKSSVCNSVTLVHHVKEGGKG